VDELEISEPAQFHALAHPMRHRLLFALGEHEATISQLAAELDTRKGNVAHHLKVLAGAGMVTVVRTRSVRGGTEQYYRRTARKFHYVGEATTEIALRAVAQEIASATDPLVVLRNVRLTGAQAADLRAALQRIIDQTEDAGRDEARHGILVALYQPGG
jgi:DNA-binding transcriptional ArsR family regulator